MCLPTCNVSSGITSETEISSTPVGAGSQAEGYLYYGVPQGLVLGPLLWNLMYNRVLRTTLPPVAVLSAMQMIA